MGYILPVTNYVAQQYHVRIIEKKRRINGVEKPYKIVLYEINAEDEDRGIDYGQYVNRLKKRKLDQLSDEGIMVEQGKGEYINVKV